MSPSGGTKKQYLTAPIRTITAKGILSYGSSSSSQPNDRRSSSSSDEVAPRTTSFCPSLY